MMIEYVINAAEGAEVFTNKEVITYKNHTNLYIIKKLCLMHLFSYDGYIKGVQNELGYKYHIPVYINYSCVMTPTQNIRQFENIWINLKRIKEIINNENGLTILFISGRKLDIAVRKKYLKTQIMKSHQIEAHKSKHFHNP